MEGRNGKCGARTGRTVRSRFAQTRGKRFEGLLMHSVVGNSSTEGNQDEGEPVGYSLGKQNRWLLPELIKTNSSEFEGEVVLVERYTRESAKTFRRPDSFSVFNSKNSSSKDDTTRKPKRKLAKAKDCARDREEPEMKNTVRGDLPATRGILLKEHQETRCSFWKKEEELFYPLDAWR